MELELELEWDTVNRGGVKVELELDMVGVAQHWLMYEFEAIPSAGCVQYSKIYCCEILLSQLKSSFFMYSYLLITSTHN